MSISGAGLDMMNGSRGAKRKTTSNDTRMDELATTVISRLNWDRRQVLNLLPLLYFHMLLIYVWVALITNKQLPVVQVKYSTKCAD